MCGKQISGVAYDLEIFSKMFHASSVRLNKFLRSLTIHSFEKESPWKKAINFKQF